MAAAIRNNDDLNSDRNNPTDRDPPPYLPPQRRNANDILINTQQRYWQAREDNPARDTYPSPRH